MGHRMLSSPSRTSCQRMMKGASIPDTSSPRAATVETKYNHFRTRCYNSNALEHIAWKCNPERNDNSDHSGQNIRVATMSKNDPTDDFIIGFGASKHITSDLGHFSSVGDTGPITVHLADNTTVTIKLQVSVLLKL